MKLPSEMDWNFSSLFPSFSIKFLTQRLSNTCNSVSRPLTFTCYHKNPYSHTIKLLGDKTTLPKNLDFSIFLSLFLNKISHAIYFYRNVCPTTSTNREQLGHKRSPKFQKTLILLKQNFFATKLLSKESNLLFLLLVFRQNFAPNINLTPTTESLNDKHSPKNTEILILAK